jgi:hypothetical protein
MGSTHCTNERILGIDASGYKSARQKKRFKRGNGLHNPKRWPPREGRRRLASAPMNLRIASSTAS